MNVLRVRVVVPLLAAVSVVAWGCASPPDAEKKAADSAVSAANAAGAEQYAPSEFAAMTAGLRKAESEMSNKAYKEAKASYESVKGLADQAAKAAESGKASAKAEAEKKIGDFETRWRDLAGKAEASAKKMTADQKAAWETDTKVVAEALESAKAAVASDAAMALAKLSTIPALLDKWEADLTSIAAAKEEKPAAPEKKSAAGGKRAASKK